MIFPTDIEKWISDHFSSRERVIGILSEMDATVRCDRAIRCVLYLSDRDYDSLRSWVKKANADAKYLNFAEYDNRNIKRFDFNKSLFQ